MINSLKHAMLTDTGRVQFNQPLSKPAPSSYNRGWNIDGTYWTTTDPRGNHMLNLDGSLESPETLGPEFAHYVGFKIASDSKISSEIFWTGYEPPSRSTLGSKASFPTLSAGLQLRFHEGPRLKQAKKKDGGAEVQR